MSYQISKEIRIVHEQDDWAFTFTTDEYGTVTVVCTEGLEAMTGKTTHNTIPHDCIQHFIKALGEV